MSSLIVEVCRVDEILPHPNADRMAVARIKGWYVCIAKNAAGEPAYRPGDRVVYFPPDCVVPPAVAERHGVAKYLGHLPKREDGTRPAGGRVLVANLRGFKSYGYLAAPDDPSWEVGRDVSEHYGITKFEPPPRMSAGEAEVPHPAFHRYYDMENIRNFPDVLQPGEEVVCTEKIHGENCRLGLIRDTTPAGETVWKWMAGSRDVRRRRFPLTTPDGKPPAESVYWRCWTPALRALVCELSGCGFTPEEIDSEPQATAAGHDIVLFGERFGSGVQDMWYGLENGHFAFRAFDVTVDGKYLDFDAKQALFAKHGVPTVPLLYRGPYSFAKIEELTEGPTAVVDPDKAGAKNFKEGVVVLSVKERFVPHEKRAFERAQLKCIGFAYLARKDGTEFH